MCLKCLLMYLQYKNCAINCDILHFKILIFLKNTSLKMVKMTSQTFWISNFPGGSMPLDPPSPPPPPNVSHHFAPFVFYGSMTYVPCRCMENMKKTYTPILCLLSQNGKGRLDFPTNGLKKALCGRDWVVMESLGNL